MKYSEFFKLIKQKGWYCFRQAKGSHEIWTNGKIEISIPNHGSKEMPKGTERKFKKKMGL